MTPKTAPLLNWETGKLFNETTLISQKANFILQRFKIENLQHNNNAGKQMPNHLKQNTAKNYPNNKDSAGKLTQPPEEIKSTFKNFYTKLSSEEICITPFLNIINLPTCLKYRFTENN